MGEKLGGMLRRHWLALLALFVALGGTGYAASQLPKNSVKAKQIAKNAVGGSELKADAVTGEKVADGSIGAGDLAAGVAGQGPQGDPGPQGEVGLQGPPGPAQPRVVQAGSTTDGGCSDDDHNGGTCGTATINLAVPSSLRADASGNWITTAFDDVNPPGDATDNVDFVHGTCLLKLDGTTIPGTTQRSGERRAIAGANAVMNPGGLATGPLDLTGFVASVPAGMHTVTVDCTEEDGDIDWLRIHLAVTAAPLP